MFTGPGRDSPDRGRSTRARTPMNQGSRISVLVADPDPRVRAEMSMILRREPDLEVLAETDSSSDLLVLASRYSPDVVVSSLSCHGPVSLAALRELSERAPGARVLITAFHVDSRYAEGLLRAGARGYLLKDRAAEELVGAIHALAADRVYVSPDVLRNGIRNRAGAHDDGAFVVTPFLRSPEENPR